MKSMLLSFFVLLSLSQARAQTYQYVPFPDSGAVWVTTSECAWWMGTDQNGHDIIGHSYQYNDDEIKDTQTINGLLYHKLFERHFLSGTLNQIGYLREDTINHQVFFRNTSFGIDTLLYDFSLHIGDSLPINSVFCPNCISRLQSMSQVVNPKALITTIDTISYNSILRKRFHFNIYDDTGGIVMSLRTYDIIEGVGCLGGLLNSTGFDIIHPDPCWTELSCFSIIDTLVYPVLAFDSICQIQSTAGLALIKADNLIISPNPTADLLHLSISEMNGANYQLILTDILGQEVYTSSVTQSESTHDISNLSHGMYTWRLMGNNAIIKTGKIVKDQGF